MKELVIFTLFGVVLVFGVTFLLPQKKSFILSKRRQCFWWLEMCSRMNNYRRYPKIPKESSTTAVDRLTVVALLLRNFGNRWHVITFYSLNPTNDIILCTCSQEAGLQTWAHTDFRCELNLATPWLPVCRTHHCRKWWRCSSSQAVAATWTIPAIKALSMFIVVDCVKAHGEMCLTEFIKRSTCQIT